MGLISPSDQDVAKIKDATTQVISDAISQIATVLVPAVGEALKGAASGITITVGPITIAPIKITLGSE